MKVFILIPEGKGGQSILVKGADNAMATLKTTRFFFLKSYSDGTPLNGYFVDEALTDEFGYTIPNLKQETDLLCKCLKHKTGIKLYEYFKKQKTFQAKKSDASARNSVSGD